MAPLELAFLAALTLYAYLASRALGLHDDIPPAGIARAQFYTSRILAILKDELRHATELVVMEHEVSYVKCGSSERRTLFLREAALKLRTAGTVTDLHALGERGALRFHQSSPTSLDITVASEAEAGQLQNFCLTLPVGRPAPPLSLVFQPDGSRVSSSSG